MARTIEDYNSYLGFGAKLTRIENIRDSGPSYLIDAEDIDWHYIGLSGVTSTSDLLTYIQNQSLKLGNTSTTAAAGNHKHAISLIKTTDTAAINLEHATSYKLTAGGNPIIFTTPSDNGTTYTAGTGLSLIGTEFKHSNSITAQTTEGLYKIKYDSQGHINGSTPITMANMYNMLLTETTVEWQSNDPIEGNAQMDDTPRSPGSLNVKFGDNSTITAKPTIEVYEDANFSQRAPSDYYKIEGTYYIRGHCNILGTEIWTDSSVKRQYKAQDTREAATLTINQPAYLVLQDGKYHLHDGDSTIIRVTAKDSHNEHVNGTFEVEISTGFDAYISAVSSTAENENYESEITITNLTSNVEEKVISVNVLKGTFTPSYSPNYKPTKNITLLDHPIVLEAPSQTYYWYVGQTNPSTMSSISGTADYNNGGGWTSTGNSVPETINQLVKGFDSSKEIFVAVPITSGTTLKPVASDMSTIDTSVHEVSTKTLNGVNYQIYTYGTGSIRKTIMFAKK